ncbi:putative Thaumatin family [Helianthus annuus]|nr:putative Thaumatin family [Helianthus annuus]KAJ0446166.1 putative Thaumatin family [Helianthus annuus]KAJ0631119.1 putative Thaumatin family [Helianthus annuus]KAJ0634994.1 putative Thaumatin family [Helianthus annuus]
MTTSTLSTFLLFALLLLHSTSAAVFNIRNNCRYTVWAGAVPGGGRQLNPGQTWALTVAAGTKGARIWPRTGCTFDGSGRGRCQTGDCNGLLQCQNYVDGFNVPMTFKASSGGCSRSIVCTADINGQCPSQLRAPGGCNNPCTVFKTEQYCCNNGPCGPTDFSRFFKQRCPDAYSYPQDDRTSLFTCPGGTNYEVIFCP